MELYSLGAHGPRVSRIGLGCMGMSGMYGAVDRYNPYQMAMLDSERGRGAAG